MGETIDTMQESIDGLKGIRLDENYTPKISSRSEILNASRRNALLTPAASYAGYAEAGNSRYDRQQELTEQQYYNLPNYRGEQQSAALKLANGLAKGAALAATTFLDGTLGFVFGASEAAAEGNVSKLWDNDFSRSLKALNDSIEEILPNYYTDAEKDKSIIQQLGTSNFWGDKLIKNLGFTVGAFYSGAMWSKPLQLFNALKNIGVGSTIASGLGATMSAVNEGRIEALNNSTDWFNLQKQQLDDEYSNQRERLEFFKNTTAYDELVDNLNTDYNNKLQTLNDNKNKVGNLDLAYNLPILLASNIIQFGKLYANGFNTASRLNKLSSYSNVGKYSRAGLNALSEGTEEMFQAIAADIAGNQYYNDKPNLSFNKAQIDDRAEQQTVSWMNAAAKALKDNLGSKESWEEFTIGTLTGFLGMPTFGKANNANAWIGKDKLVGISGGVVGEARDYQKEWDEAKEINDRIEKRLQSPEFLNYYHGLTRHNKFQNDMNQASANGRAKEFKDAEYAQMISDIQMFNTAGRIDDYIDIVSNAFDTSDENLQKIVEVTTSQDESTGLSIGPFIDSKGNPMYSTDEGKQEMINKLETSRKEMLNAVNTYRKEVNNIDTRYGDIFTENQRAELVWLKMLSDNQHGRSASISEEIKPYINQIADKLESDLLSESLYGTDSNNERSTETVRKNISTLRTVASMKSDDLAAQLVINSPLRHFILNNLDKVSGDKTIEDIKQDIKDINSLFKDANSYNKKLEEYLNNPEKLIKDQEKETTKERKNIFNRRNTEAKQKLDSASTNTEVEEIRKDTTIDSEIKDKAIRESTNPVVKDNSEIHNRASYLKSKVSDKDSQIKSDVEYLTDLLENSVKSLGEFSINNPILEDAAVHLLEAPVIDGNTKTPAQRATDAVQAISNILNERTEHNNSSTVKPAESLQYGEFTEDLGEEYAEGEEDEDNPTAGSQEVGTTKPLPVNVNKSDKHTETENTAISENDTEVSFVEKTDIVNGNSSEKNNEEAWNSTGDGNAAKDNNLIINPSSHQYKYNYNTDTGISLVPIDAANEGEEAIRNISYLENYQSKNGIFNAFDFINSGRLAEYKANGGLLYLGIDPSLDSELPLLYINRDDEYLPIGTLYKSANALEKRGLKDITENLKSKVSESVFVDKDNAITDYEISTGRFGYNNTTPRGLKSLLSETNIEPGNAEIVVNFNGEFISSSGITNADCINSGSFPIGMSGIAVPNAHKGSGEREYTIIPIIPKRVSQLLSDDNLGYTKKINTILNAISNAITSDKSYEERKNNAMNYISLLSQYVNIADLEIIFPKNGGLFLKRITRDANRKIVRDSEGKTLSSSLIYLEPENTTKENIVGAFKNAFTTLEAPVRISKNNIDDENYIELLIDSDAIITYATSLQPKDATVFFKAPSASKSINNDTKAETSTEVSTPTESSNDLDDLGDVLYMADNTIQSVSAEELIRYGLDLDTDYSISDVLSLFDNIETPFKKDVLKAILTGASENNIIYRFENNPDTKAYGQYSNGVVTLFTSPSNPKFIHSLLHETIHAFSAAIIERSNDSLPNNIKEAKESLIAIYNEARKNGVVNEFGASSSLHEFIAELANPRFVEQLSNIDYPSENQSFFSKIIEAIKRFFGINNTLASKAEKILKQFIVSPVSDTNNREFNRDNDNIYYMTLDDAYNESPTDFYIGDDSNEIENKIRDYKSQTFDYSRVLEIVDEINAFAGKELVGFTSSGINNRYSPATYKIYMKQQLTKKELDELDNKRLLKVSNSEMTKLEIKKQAVKNLGYSDSDLEAFDENMLDYVLNCEA